MKMTRILLASTALCTAAGIAQAQDMNAEIFTSWTSGGEQQALAAITEHFTAAGGSFEIASIAGYESANAALLNRMMAGDPPTAYQAVIGLDQAEMIAAGMLAPITEIAEAGNWAEVLPQPILDNITVDGEIYLAPTGVHGESWMFYSTAAFEAAGIDGAPADWDEFFADMDALEAAGIVPIAWGGQSWQEAKVFNMVLLSQVGLDGFLQIYVDHDPEVIGSDAVRSTLEIFARLRDYVDAGAPGRNWNDATSMVITGQAGVQFMGDWAKGEFTAAGQTAGVEFGCALAPASPGMIYIGDSFAFPNLEGEGVGAAQTLWAESILSPEVQTRFSLLKGSIPVRTDVDPSVFDVCTQQGLELMAEGAIVPEHAITITPDRVGMLVDFVGEFFNTPDADIDDAMEAFAEVFE